MSTPSGIASLPLPLLRSLFAALTFAACAPSPQPFLVDVPLRVVATEPSGAAVGVSRNVLPRVWFSEALRQPPSDAFKLLSVAADDSTAPLFVDFSFETTADGEHVVTVAPRIRLAPGTRHRLIVETTVRRAHDGARLPSRVSLEFTTETPPPLDVIDVTPGHGAEGLSTSPRISVRFSEPPRCPLEGVSLVEVPDPVAQPEASAHPLAGSWTCTTPGGSSEGEAACTDDSAGDPCRVTFVDAVTGGNPVFGPGSEVRLTLRGADADGDGPVVRSRRAVGRNGLLRRTSSVAMAIAHPPPLTLERTEPPDGAVGVSTSKVVTLWFSEPPTCGDVLSKGVAVTEAFHASWGGGERLVSGEWTCPPPLSAGEACSDGPLRCAVRFTAASTGEAPYRTSSGLRVEIRGGDDPLALRSARVTSGGGWFVATRELSFRIEDPPPLLVAESSPRNGDGDAPPDSEVVLRFNQAVDPASVIPCGVDESGVEIPANCHALLRRVDVAPEETVALTSLCVSEGDCAPELVRLAPIGALEHDATYRFTLEPSGDAPRPRYGHGVLLAPHESVFRIELDPGG